jgi:DNA (cytosine-5)-methyltransferase 1
LEDQHVNAGCPLFVPTLAFDTTQVTSKANRSNPQPGDPCHPLAAGAHAPAIALPVGIFQDSEFGVKQYESAGTIRAGRIPEHQMVLQPAIAFSSNLISPGRKTRPEEVAGALTGDCLNPHQGNEALMILEPAIAFSKNDDGGDCETELSPTMRVAGRAGGHLAAFTGGVDYENNGHTPDEPTGPLLKGSPTGGGRPLPAISLPNMQVRRLTPIECERLQGFPDNWTRIPYRNKPASECPDGPRYKSLGNSWATPVVAWIGRRIDKAVNP